MVDEQQLDDHRAARRRLLAARAHDHSVGGLGIAANLQLRHPFDLDQTDAAEARRTQFAMITVDGNLLLDLARSLDQERAFLHLHRYAVDGHLDEVRHVRHRMRSSLQTVRGNAGGPILETARSSRRADRDSFR